MSVSVVDDFGTVVLSVDDSVAGGDGHGKEDSGFLVCFTRAGGDYSSFCLFDFGLWLLVLVDWVVFVWCMIESDG